MGKQKTYKSGQKYNHITLVEELGSYNYQGKNKCRLWKCICDCGKEFNATTRQLKNGLKSCGCNVYRKFHEYPAQINYKCGQRFREFVIVERNLTRKHTAWLCKCDCGKEFVTSTRSIQRGRVSCGCSSKKHRIKQKYFNNEANIKHAIRQYRYGAKIRNLEFLLTDQECLELLFMSCHYCGKLPSRLISRTKCCLPTEINGIDRKNNSLGYIMRNVVPCCTICNRAKNSMTYEEFLDWIRCLCVNASHVNERYEPVNNPIRIEL